MFIFRTAYGIIHFRISLRSGVIDVFAAYVNDILEMSRIENGKMELEIIPADLCGIFRDLYQCFQ